MTNVGDGYVGVHDQLGLKANGQRESSGEDCTHGEDLKDSIDVRLPTSDRIFVILCMDKSGE